MKRRLLMLVGVGLVLAACGADPKGRDPNPVPPTEGDAGSPPDAGAGDASPVPSGPEWPNAESKATSDPWLAQNHDRIAKMRPKILAINFDNDPATRNNFHHHIEQVMAGLADGSRYHGYTDTNAKPFVEYEVFKWVDLADETPPPGWTHKRSSRVPVNCASKAFYNFDYAALTGPEMAKAYDVADPKDPSRKLPLCELMDQGMVHEVWIHMNGDTDPHTCADGKVLDTVGFAEILESKPIYDQNNVKKPGKFDPCAGNGCLATPDFEAFKACGRTVRVLYLNSTRGPGCALHSAGHGYEWMARSGAVPELGPRFDPFGNFDLRTKHGVDFDDWYACSEPNCIVWTSDNSLTWKVKGTTGNIAKLDQACGNVHFAPNARAHYDENDGAVLSSCEHYGLHDGPGGRDAQEPFSRAKYARYEKMAPDCGGAWQIYWRQSFPGFGNRARDEQGKPMRNWWPYLFY